VREYEVTIIVQPNLEEEARKVLVADVNELLAPGASEEEKPAIKEWGLRRLAYPIQKHQEGYYVLYEGLVDPARVTEIERNMQYREDILRYLVIRKEV